ncbi:hypothetical protein Hanom_Chr03g00262431 [Helianthus anomalus]
MAKKKENKCCVLKHRYFEQGYVRSIKTHIMKLLIPPIRILTRRWRVRVLFVPNAPTVADLPPDSGLLGGGLRGGITSAVGKTVEYPPPLSHQSTIYKD